MLYLYDDEAQVGFTQAESGIVSHPALISDEPTKNENEVKDTLLSLLHFEPCAAHFSCRL